LKAEISDKMDVDHVVVPKHPNFKNKQINEQINAFYQIGLNDEVYKLINEIAYFMDVIYSDHDRTLARNYLALINESNNASKTVLTTHIRALFDQYTYNTIVFDEDPLSSLLVIKKLELSDLLILEQSANDKNPITQMIDFIRASQPGVITGTKFFGIDKLTIAKLLPSLNIKSIKSTLAP
jgi:hypothetical protein